MNILNDIIVLKIILLTRLQRSLTISYFYMIIDKLMSKLLMN